MFPLNPEGEAVLRHRPSKLAKGNGLASLTLAAKPTHFKRAFQGMFRCSTRRSATPISKRRRLEIFAHQLDNLARFESELDSDRIEGRSIFPGHLDDAINLRHVQLNLAHASSLKLLSPEFRRSVFPRRRHRSLQCFTSSQTLAHFRRQVIERLQTAHVFSGKFSFLMSRDS